MGNVQEFVMWLLLSYCPSNPEKCVVIKPEPQTYYVVFCNDKFMQPEGWWYTYKGRHYHTRDKKYGHKLIVSNRNCEET